MNTKSATSIPSLAIEAVHVSQELIKNIEGAYLFGSAVEGGLRADSDVDVLIVTRQRLPLETRQELVERLMRISGKTGNSKSIRPLELTVVNLNDIVPWQYPPKSMFVYGEWMREQYENNYVPDQKPDPDLAIVLSNVRMNSIPIIGPNAQTLLEPVPGKDFYLAIKESLPDLLSGRKGDERNVLLTLSRMWITVSTGKVVSKDIAAKWTTGQLPAPLKPLMIMARKAYLGEIKDNWDERENEVTILIKHMKQEIESCIEHKSWYKTNQADAFAFSCLHSNI